MKTIGFGDKLNARLIPLLIRKFVKNKVKRKKNKKQKGKIGKIVDINILLFFRDFTLKLELNESFVSLELLSELDSLISRKRRWGKKY